MTDTDLRSQILMPTLSKLALAVGCCLVLSLLACGGSEPASSPEPSSPAASPADEAGEASETTFEPAFPEDVSAEGLTSDDVEQAAAAHSDDGHSHGEDGDHSHGDDGHSHDEGGDHSHGEDGHSHDDGDHSHGEGEGDHGAA